MKLTVNNKRLLIMLGSALALLLSYFFVFTPQIEEAQLVIKKNDELFEKYMQLLDIQSNQEKYKTDIADMESEVLAYLKQFPAEIRAEDVFLMGRDIEKEAEMTINNVGLEEAQLLASVAGITIHNPDEDQTLANKNNENTKEQVDKIEGVEQVDNTTVTADGSAMSLFNTTNNINFAVSYEGIKKTIEYINQLDRRTTIEGLSAAFDDATGNLSGSITLNMFSMNNTGAVYKEPVVDGVPVGRSNIFGTAEAANGKKTESAQTQESNNTAESNQTQESE